MYDIIISGAGFVGRILAIYLSDIGYSVCLIDRKKILEDKIDNRSITISYASSQILEKIGLWNKIQENSTPINDIFTYNENCLNSFVHFDNKNISSDPLGFVVKGSHLYKCINEKVSSSKYNIKIMEETEYEDIKFNGRNITLKIKNNQIINSYLFICSEGRQSHLKEKFNIKNIKYKYNQYSLVCDLKLPNTIKHNNIAQEIFLQNGPIAILPSENNTMGLILTSNYNTINSLITEDNDKLLQYLYDKMKIKFDSVLGPKHKYPITLNFSLKYFHKNILFMGDTIHGIHPVAGQGLNISLYDISCLVCLIKQYGLKNTKLLQMFEKERMKKNMSMILFTHSLIKIFEKNNLIPKVITSIGMLGINNISSIKNTMIKNAMGIGQTY